MNFYIDPLYKILLLNNLISTIIYSRFITNAVKYIFWNIFMWVNYIKSEFIDIAIMIKDCLRQFDLTCF